MNAQLQKGHSLRYFLKDTIHVHLTFELVALLSILRSTYMCYCLPVDCSSIMPSQSNQSSHGYTGHALLILECSKTEVEGSMHNVSNCLNRIQVQAPFLVNALDLPTLMYVTSEFYFDHEADILNRPKKGIYLSLIISIMSILQQSNVKIAREDLKRKVSSPYEYDLSQVRDSSGR